MTVDYKSCTNSIAILDQCSEEGKKGEYSNLHGKDVLNLLTRTIWGFPKLGIFGRGTLNLCLTLKLRSEEAQGGDGQHSLVSSILAEQNQQNRQSGNSQSTDFTRLRPLQDISIHSNHSSKQKTKNK